MSNLPQIQLDFSVVDLCFTTESFNMTNEEHPKQDKNKANSCTNVAYKKNLQLLCRNKINQVWKNKGNHIEQK